MSCASEASDSADRSSFDEIVKIAGFSLSEYTKNDKFVPLLWTPSEVVSLNQFAGFGSPDSVWTKVTLINGINDNGYIIGRGVFDYHKHAFVLIPK